MAVEGLNLNNLTVDSNGRVSFSGLGSGIDWHDTVDKIIAARRVPVDTLETRVTDNEDKIAALKELRTNLSALQSSLAKLYGAVSYQNTSNIFEAKSAFASVSRLDGQTPTAAGTLVGATVSNAASTGVHTIEILRTAKAHKVSSDSQSSATTALGITSGSTFTIEGVTITVNSTDSLNDLRDRINAANTGTSPTGVTASIVSVGSSENYLLLTKDDTGESMTLADTSGTALQTLGILTGAGAVKNQLQAAQTAQFYADGLLDQTNTIYESGFQTASTDQIGSAGTLSFTLDADGSALGTVNYLATDTLADLAANITANVTGATASVVTDGDGVRLEITSASAFSFSETGAGTAIDDLELDNKRRVIERDTNTVSDLFTGITLTLYQAEQGTTVQLEVERDLSQVKTEITNFVTAYNDLRSFINGHRLFDTSTGSKSDDAGVLFNSPALAEVMSSLTTIIGTGATGTDADFSALGSIGINFTAYDVSDPLLAETLEIDEAALDEALLNNPDDVRRLFTFDLTTSDPRVTLLGFDGNTTYSSTGYTLNLQPNTAENLALYSEQLDNAAWSPVRATVSADGTTAPDGTMTADGLVADATTNTHYITNATAYNLTAGETYVFSTYVKAGNKDDIRITVGGPALSNDSARVEADLGTGTITSTTSATSTTTGVEEADIEDVGNGWYRVSMKVTATQTSTAFMELYAKDAGTASFTGDGSTVNAWFWGTQVSNATYDTVVLTDADVTGTRASLSANAVAAPDGNVTGDGLVGSTDNNSHLVSNTAAISVTAGEQYDYVAYVQQGARSQVRLALSGGNFAANTNADFDLAGGTVSATGSGVDNATITSVGGGWYKVVITATAATTGTAQMDLYARDAATGLAFAGDGATVDTYFWDQKLVHTETSPAYAPTTSTAGTVSATANIDGAAGGASDGTATVSGSTITVTDGGAKGLKLFFSGFSVADSVDLDFTVGVGAQLYFAISELLERSGTVAGGDLRRGAVEAELDQLEDQNEVHNDRITEMLARLEIQRNSLLERFLKMEQALYTGNRILDSIKQATEAMFGSNN